GPSAERNAERTRGRWGRSDIKVDLQAPRVRNVVKGQSGLVQWIGARPQWGEIDGAAGGKCDRTVVVAAERRARVQDPQLLVVELVEGQRVGARRGDRTEDDDRRADRRHTDRLGTCSDRPNGLD